MAGDDYRFGSSHLRLAVHRRGLIRLGMRVVLGKLFAPLGRSMIVQRPIGFGGLSDRAVDARPFIFIKVRRDRSAGGIYFIDRQFRIVRPFAPFRDRPNRMTPARKKCFSRFP